LGANLAPSPAVTRNIHDRYGLPPDHDAFVAAERAKAGDESLKAAPVHAPRRRLDETLAARKPVLVYKDAEPAQAAE